MNKKPNMEDVFLQLEDDKPKKPQQTKAVKDLLKARPLINPNPVKGERGSFERFSLTLPLDMLKSLRAISFKRKMDKLPNAELVSIVREAIDLFLQKQ